MIVVVTILVIFTLLHMCVVCACVYVCESESARLWVHEYVAASASVYMCMCVDARG